MKKFIFILFAITLCLSSVCYADIDVEIDMGEYVFEHEYGSEVKYNSDIAWSGKEWITISEYPPRVSADGINFTKLAGSDEVEEVLNSKVYTYYWTGSDYLLYQPIGRHDHIYYQTDKYMYRISEDMQTLLGTYTIPDYAWVNDIEYKDGQYYILTENVMPVFAENNSDRVMGVTYRNFKLYKADSLNSSTEAKLPFDFAEYDYRPTLDMLNGNMIIVNYDYKNSKRNMGDYSDMPIKNLGIIMSDEIYEVDFEKFDGKSVDICGEYFYSEIYDSEIDKERLAFSKDGVYWEYTDLADINYVMKVYEKNDSVIIRYFKKTEKGSSAALAFIDKDSLYSQLENNLSNTNTYVRLNDKILGFSQPPIMEDDRTLVPKRFLFEQMGAEVTWDEVTQSATATINASVLGAEEASATGRATLSNSDISFPNLAETEKSVTFSIDNTTATVNGAPAIMDVPARLINDQTFVPLRFLSENLGYTVDWDETTNTAIVLTK